MVDTNPLFYMNSYLGPQGKVLSGLKASNCKNARESKAPRIPTHVWPCAKLQGNGCSLEMVASRMIKIIELPKNSELRDDDVEEPSSRMA